jgi:hypothetical protein
MAVLQDSRVGVVIHHNIVIILQAFFLFFLALKSIKQPYKSCKWRYTLSVKLIDFTVSRYTWRKNRVHCAVLTGNSAGLWTLSSRLLHREMRSLVRDSHGFLSLPADTTMASSQGTSVSRNSFSRWTSHDILLFKYHLLLHILRFLFFFSEKHYGRCG